MTIMELVFRQLGPTYPLKTFGDSGFRTRWNHLVSEPGVSLAKAPGGFNLTPACLSGLSTTFFP